MSNFEQSRWADGEFSENYRTYADTIIQERRKLIGILRSFYGRFLGGRSEVEILDLGCGDGTLTRVLMDGFPGVRPTLVDGSQEMLDRAAELLEGLGPVRFVKAAFQEIISGDGALSEYDFIFSSLAIHHLESAGKSAIYRCAYDHLRPGGYFVNIDVVLPPSDALEGWYLEIWRDWIARAGGPQAPGAQDIPSQYKGNPDNVPDSLESQLKALERAGFGDVDCYYKHGIFAVFGGCRRPE